MKLRKALIACIFLAAVGLFSCGSNALIPKGDAFYYYPSKNVYYHVGDSNFIYSLDSGKTWDSMRVPVPEPAIFGDRETIYSDDVAIWKYNDAHREKYNGKLLNIINEESLKVPEPEPEPSDAIAANEEEEQQKEKKRPIKRFFQKLFGKKNKWYKLASAGCVINR